METSYKETINILNITWGGKKVEYAELLLRKYTTTQERWYKLKQRLIVCMKQFILLYPG